MNNVADSEIDVTVDDTLEIVKNEILNEFPINPSNMLDAEVAKRREAIVNFLVANGQTLQDIKMTNTTNVDEDRKPYIDYIGKPEVDSDEHYRLRRIIALAKSLKYFSNKEETKIEG